MSIESELTARFRSSAAAGHLAARNDRMFLHYYGFGDAPWPSLAETAAAVGLGTRERVRQVLSATLAELAADRPQILDATARLIRSRPLWPATDLITELARKTGDSSRLSAKGLLNLLHDLGLLRAYDAYTPKLEALSRRQAAEGCAYVLAHKDRLEPLQWGLTGARRLSLRRGLVRTRDLAAALGPDAPLAELKTLVRLDPTFWTSSSDSEFWFALETTDNPLVALAAKAAAVAERAPPAELADALRNALRGRTGAKFQPDCGVVESWVRSSRWFEQAAGSARFLGRPGELTPVERDLVRYLRGCGAADYPAIRKHLRAHGQGDSMIAKTTTQSPIIWVDRSGGARAFRYSLVGASPKGQQPPPADHAGRAGSSPEPERPSPGEGGTHGSAAQHDQDRRKGQRGALTLPAQPV